QSRVVRELRKHPEVVGPALEKIAEALTDFSRRSVAAGAAGIFYAISGYAGRNVMPEGVYRDLVLPYDEAVLGAMPAGTWLDRKSTRLNSSHQIISYAVFCLTK